MLKQGQVYETIAEAYPKICEHDNPNAIESDNQSPKVKKVPSDAHEISRNISQKIAEEETRNITAIPAEETRYTISIQEDDPEYVKASIHQEGEHKTPAKDENYEVPALPVEIPGYPEFDSERFEGINPDNTYQKLSKQESHDHKVKENLSDYQELDQCRREVGDNNIYQKLVKA